MQNFRFTQLVRIKYAINIEFNLKRMNSTHSNY